MEQMFQMKGTKGWIDDDGEPCVYEPPWTRVLHATSDVGGRNGNVCQAFSKLAFRHDYATP